MFRKFRLLNFFFCAQKVDSSVKSFLSLFCATLFHNFAEEEMKRLNEALQANSYGAVAFNYTSQGQTEAAGVGNEEATKHQGAFSFLSVQSYI